MSSFSILVADDDATIGMSLSEVLAGRDHTVWAVVTSEHEVVRLRRPDAVILEKPFHEAELAEAIDFALTQTPEPSE